jgi:hypothetical protein
MRYSSSTVQLPGPQPSSGPGKTYYFDVVVPPEGTQQDVFESAPSTLSVGPGACPG